MEFQAERVDHVTCPQCRCAIVTTGAKPLGSIPCPQCNSPVLIPARFDGRFLVTRVLGKGTSGIVLKAFDEQLQRNVAIKILRRESREDQRIADQCIREARALAAINHPGIIQIYSIGQYRGQHYIEMELGRHGRADKFLHADRPLDESHVLEMGIAVAGGLAAAQRVGLIHGDVKPANILLAPGHQAKLIDFGAARQVLPDDLQQPDEARKNIIGTPYYIAPEVVRGSEPNFKSDMYSLGATLFHLLTGQPPFPGQRPMEVMQQRLKKPPPWPGDLRPDLHPETCQVIYKMMATDPADRYEHYGQVIDALQEALAATLEGPASPLEANLARMAALRRTEPAGPDDQRLDLDDQPPPSRWAGKKKWLWLGGAAAAFALAGGLWTILGPTITPIPAPPPPPPNRPPVITVAPSIRILTVTPAGQVVATVQAEDPDPGNKVTFQLQWPAGTPQLPLAIDEQGRITLTDPQPLQDQAGYAFQLAIRATDDGQPPRSSLAQTRIVIARPDPLTYRLVAHWPLAEDAGDRGNRHFNGRLHGNPTFVLTRTEPRERAMHLNGNDAVVVPYDPAFTPAGDMTILCRVRLPDGLEQKRDAALVTCGNNWQVHVNGDKAGQFAFSLGPHRMASRGDYFNDGQWHDVAAIRQGNQLRLYVDGLLEGRLTLSAPLPPPSPVDLVIGSHCDDLTGRGLRGYLRQIRLFDRALDEQDLKTIAQSNNQ